jgi:hypothetical protein
MRKGRRKERKAREEGRRREDSNEKKVCTRVKVLP